MWVQVWTEPGEWNEEGGWRQPRPIGKNPPHARNHMERLGQPHRWRQYVPSKHLYLPTSPHRVTTKKTTMCIFTPVKTSNITLCVELFGRDNVEEQRLSYLLHLNLRFCA
jgi:hypothetical protein